MPSTSDIIIIDERSFMLGEVIGAGGFGVVFAGREIDPAGRPSGPAIWRSSWSIASRWPSIRKQNCRSAQARPDTGSGREIPVGRRFMTGVNGTQMTMAGLTKGWADHSGKIDGQIDITFKRDPDAGPIAAPVVRAPSTGKAPTALACTFRLSIQ